MSVVVWDGRTIAADCQATNGSLKFRISKMRRLTDGTVLAWTGIHPCGLAVARWYEDGAKREDWPASQNKDDWSTLVVVLPNGRAFSYERFPEAIDVLDLPAAWGCGSEFALGAMAMGADARKAVEIASQFSAGCGFGVEAYDVKALELAKAGD